MNWELLWAGVRVRAECCCAEVLLQAAARQGIELRKMRAVGGALRTVCPARQYGRLARLARRLQLHLRIEKRRGLYFALRGLLRRKGILAGIVLFALLAGPLQSIVWWIDLGELPSVAAVRVQRELRSVGLQPGAAAQPQLLTAAEYALLAMEEEFSWSSVNFEKGRLTVEYAEAKPAPEIESEELSALVAKADGTVVLVQPQDGTVQVVPGQKVVQGQLLIGTARAERDGSLNHRRAAGRVMAQVEWQGEVQIPLCETLLLLTGEWVEWYEIAAFGRTVRLAEPKAERPHRQTMRHMQPQFFSIPLPVSVTAHTLFLQQPQTVFLSEALAAEKARVLCQRQLLAQFPDAEICAWQQKILVEDGVLTLRVRAQILADLCVRVPQEPEMK